MYLNFLYGFQFKKLLNSDLNLIYLEKKLEFDFPVKNAYKRAFCCFKRCDVSFSSLGTHKNPITLANKPLYLKRFVLKQIRTLSDANRFSNYHIIPRLGALPSTKLCCNISASALFSGNTKHSSVMFSGAKRFF
jgi:hypothetical protein